MLQEKEYKDALEAFNDKNKEKVQLITKLMEVSFISGSIYIRVYETKAEIMKIESMYMFFFL